MKYAWIEENKLRWPVCAQCRVLGANASGYRPHLARRKKILTRRHLGETSLPVEIRAVYAEARGAYGWPRVRRQLKRQGVRIGKRRVERTMRRNGLRGRGKRRFRVSTTDSNHALRIASTQAVFARAAAKLRASRLGVLGIAMIEPKARSYLRPRRSAPNTRASSGHCRPRQMESLHTSPSGRLLRLGWRGRYPPSLSLFQSQWASG